MFKLSDTKTKTKIALGLLLALSSQFFAWSIKADNESDLLDLQRQQKQQQIDELNKQIKDYQQQIAAAQGKANTLQNEVFIYDKQIASTELEIQAKQTQIDDTNLQIQELQKLIEQKARDIEENKKIMGTLLAQLQQYDDQYALKTTIGSNNLSDFLDQIQYTQSVNDNIYQLLQKIKDLKAKMEAQQHDLQVQLEQLKQLQEQLQITQDELSQQRDQKQQLLSQTKGLESNYQKLLASSKNQEADLQKEINDLDNKIRAKLGNKTIDASKGLLAWPIDGILTQGYGNTGFTSLGYTFHNGIDVAAPAGATIYAAADGTVLDIDHSDQSYGNWAAIKSTIETASGPRDIVTLYGHMRTIKVSPGQKVSQGDIVGYEGNTGNTTKKLYGPERGYHLHFGVYDAEGFGVSNGAYTKTYGPYRVPYGYTYNPLDFLPKE